MVLSTANFNPGLENHAMSGGTGTISTATFYDIQDPK